MEVYRFQLDRIVLKNYYKYMKLNSMPGFKLRWFYEPFIHREKNFVGDEATKEFVR